ncbi:MAG: GNAT family N-acetyltransferase [Actinomycetota bacterium]|nr:GNAT family N-acetyltransferase [Actinomycetota bacterium]
MEPWLSQTDIREDLEDPHLDLETDTWVVEDAGEVVGYGGLWDLREEEAEAFDAQCYTSPTHLGRGIGSFLIDRTEGAADEAAGRVRRRPLLLRNFVSAKNDTARAMLETRGYRCVRHYFHMAIALDDVGEPPAVPEGLLLRTFEPKKDAEAVHELIVDAFSEHWNWTPLPFESFRKRVQESDDFEPEFTPLIFEGDRLIGVSLNGKKVGMGWVEDLAVRKDRRGRGLGELLLRETFARFKAKGWDKVGLGVDSSNATGAVRLYERVGMHITRQFDAYERVIAP